MARGNLVGGKKPVSVHLEARFWDEHFAEKRKQSRQKNNKERKVRGWTHVKDSTKAKKKVPRKGKFKGT